MYNENTFMPKQNSRRYTQLTQIRSVWAERHRRSAARLRRGAGAGKQLKNSEEQSVHSGLFILSPPIIELADIEAPRLGKRGGGVQKSLILMCRGASGTSGNVPGEMHPQKLGGATATPARTNHCSIILSRFEIVCSISLMV
ncbi:hypothetical protein EVAR_23535_1 [Eumeta japonica]|uniref:Uncharacterized protein n=1 Tax=Eumeta variegata TaxID=151549 RepID=A0A4C1W3I1_EUMVA|nr:hypothetical protein EVAR_23535_1 [Eumeta japonica]